MKWIVGSFAHETNTFSTVATDLDAFRAQTYELGNAIPESFGGTQTPIGGFIDEAEVQGDTLVFTVASHATPSGLVTREAFETMSEHILTGIRDHPDADGILLALHGAMVAEEFDDGEGEVLTRVRQAAGDAIPVVVVLDLHSHITSTMMEQATVLIGYQEYPHTDTYVRGLEATQLIRRIVKGEVRPIGALEKPVMIPPCGTCHTRAGLYKELWAEALRPDRPPRILSTSLFAGFPYADVPPMGYAVVVYADGDPGQASEEAKRLAASAWARREEFLYQPTPVADAVSRAIGVDAKPVVIADISDNPGGGGSNDGVEILRELIRQDATEAAVATIYDPEVVEEASRAGVGQTLRVSLGAKTDRLHGKPIEIEGRVRMLFDGGFEYRGPMSRGARGSLGRSVVLEVSGIRIIVSSKRLQSRDPGIFRVAGIDPLDQKILVVKSAVHFRAAFEPIAAEIIVADAPGLTALDMSQFDFKRIRRPMFPLD